MTKVALITGASRGIGREIALTFAENGYQVVINYNGNEDKANEVKEEVEKKGAKALVVKANVADENDVKAMIKTTIDTFGRIDVVVNNAGITRDNLLMRMKEADFDAVIDTNLKGVFFMMKAVTRPMMKQKGGAIINLSSVVGLSGNPGQINYVAAKSGVIGMTKTAAKELAAKNIRVNAVAPGFITTDMTDDLPEEQKTLLMSQIPLKRLGEPKQVAEAVYFLASEKASYITGQTLSVDGGMYM
ncbi:3-oxoacyl-[acyl-carrier-protein] reductase FabG [Halolactibacillus alkaliphilus]|uniref:3-oxoacyl-[acyl-carrier-protein] reductase n=1 Tax=Halolactibacillus alkaliphilus TaxID=442899 RepID=A0A511WYS3_9BACI|nr:3-oxoacyl-[acyl-carrier-protein] reductase FabG [Halolactibacillus alkaliphilus]GGN65130.1 3-oxoacyl-[acyl-carrier-protein] reductase FabG [Halolactibacillus alkaliphilus]SFO64271.1 3-oxoacyl-[acyl-carrier-protein] reductase [Halolactibacillus alkaliphilus]